MDDKLNKLVEFNIHFNKESIRNYIYKHFILSLSFIGTIAASIFYALGYLFIYGYYFSGEIKNAYSILEIVTTPIPMNFKPILILGILFSCIVVLFFLMIKLFKQNKLLAVISLFMIHCIVTLAFIGFKIDSIWDFIFFMLVWVLPILIWGMIRYFVIVNKKPILIISGFSYCIIFMWILSYIGNLTGKSSYIQSWQSTIILFTFTLLFFIPNIIFYYIEKEKLKDPYSFYIVFFSIISAISILIIVLITLVFKIKAKSYIFCIINLLFLLIDIIILKLTKGYFSRNYGNLYLKSEVILNPETRQNNVFPILLGFEKSRCFLVIVLMTSTLFAFLTISYSYIVAGNMVRVSTLNIQKDFIQFVYNGKPREIIGKVVAVKDNQYYISDNNYNLVILKTSDLSSYNIYSIIDTFADEQQLKWLKNASIIDFEFYQFDDDPEYEVVIFKKPNLVVIDRDFSGAKTILSLDDVESKTISGNDITVFTSNQGGGGNNYKSTVYVVEHGIAKIKQ